MFNSGFQPKKPSKKNMPRKPKPEKPHGYKAYVPPQVNNRAAGAIRLSDGV